MTVSFSFKRHHSVSDNSVRTQCEINHLQFQSMVAFDTYVKTWYDAKLAPEHVNTFHPNVTQDRDQAISPIKLTSASFFNSFAW